MLPKLSSLTLADFAPELAKPATPPRGASAKRPAWALPPTLPSPQSDSPQPLPSAQSPPSPIPMSAKHLIKIAIDGANVGRSRFNDPEYTGDARRAFDTRREEAGVHCKPIHANAILAVFEHIMRANVSSNVEYVPMIFVAEHVLSGGRNGAMAAFAAHKLLADEMKAFVTTTPSRRDDDEIQLAYLVRENDQGRPTYIISQDLFTDHVRNGSISTELLESRLLSFTFVADSQDVIISTPNKQELPGL